MRACAALGVLCGGLLAIGCGASAVVPAPVYPTRVAPVPELRGVVIGVELEGSFASCKAEGDALLGWISHTLSLVGFEIAPAGTPRAATARVQLFYDSATSKFEDTPCRVYAGSIAIEPGRIELIEDENGDGWREPSDIDAALMRLTESPEVRALAPRASATSATSAPQRAPFADEPAF